MSEESIGSDTKQDYVVSPLGEIYVRSSPSEQSRQKKYLAELLRTVYLVHRAELEAPCTPNVLKTHLLPLDSFRNRAAELFLLYSNDQSTDRIENERRVDLIDGILRDSYAFPQVEFEAKSFPSEDRTTALERENSELCHFVSLHAPHKQVLKTSLAFLAFFSGVLTIQLFGGIWLISSGLAWAGIAVSISGVLLSYLAGLDWRDWRSQKDASH